VFNNVSEEKSNEKQRADFISTASHEMRTPVAAIEGYLALALNDKVSTIDVRARGYLEKAHASTQHLGQLFQDLLTSAKAEDGRLTSHPTVVEMGEFLGQLVSDLRLVAINKGLAVDFAAGSDAFNTSVINATRQEGQRTINPLYFVYVDPDRLREVITNLFDNAVKYTPEGKITFGLTGNDQVAQCFIKDTGSGIPPEDVPHLFQKFYRVDSSATRTIGGTGLGLFICRKIVELYKGRIWVESVAGQGSTFYINFPRLSTDRARELQAQSSAESVTSTQPINYLRPS
jgi:signal transduction histidine kinase